jgi:hypothetical protein
VIYESCHNWTRSTVCPLPKAMNVTKLDIMFDSQHFKNKFPQFGLNIFRSSIIFVNIKLCIHQRFPNIIEQRRKNLYPVQKEAKQNGQQTVLVHDQLFINSVLYQCDYNMDELHQANDTRNESRPDYRDALLTTTSKESQRPSTRQRYGTSPINDSCPSNSTYDCL